MTVLGLGVSLGAAHSVVLEGLFISLSSCFFSFLLLQVVIFLSNGSSSRTREREDRKLGLEEMGGAMKKEKKRKMEGGRMRKELKRGKMREELEGGK